MQEMLALIKELNQERLAPSVLVISGRYVHFVLTVKPQFAQSVRYKCDFIMAETDSSSLKKAGSLAANQLGATIFASHAYLKQNILQNYISSSTCNEYCIWEWNNMSMKGAKTFSSQAAIAAKVFSAIAKALFTLKSLPKSNIEIPDAQLFRI